MAKYIRESEASPRNVSVYVNENDQTIFVCTGFRGDDGVELTPEQSEKLAHQLIHAAKVARKNILLATVKEIINDDK